LESPIIYPTDVRLLYKAFGKMAAVAREGQIEPWWDQPHVNNVAASNLNQKDRLAYLREFSTLFVPAFASFNEHLDHLPKSPCGSAGATCLRCCVSSMSKPNSNWLGKVT